MTLTNDDLQLFKKAALVFRGINHKLRNRIYYYLSTEGEKTVTELYNQFALEQSVASQQLAIMRKAGWLKIRKDKKNVFYSVNEPKVSTYLAVARSICQLQS